MSSNINGHARLAVVGGGSGKKNRCGLVAYLIDKYHDAGVLTAVIARNEIKAISMGRREHTDSLFKRLATIKVKYQGILNLGVNDTTLIAQVITTEPEAYSTTITQVSMQASAAGANMTLENLNTAMRSQYAIMSKGRWNVQRPG